VSRRFADLLDCRALYCVVHIAQYDMHTKLGFSMGGF
jgi:hypothetical protein